MSPANAHHNVGVIAESRNDQQRATIEYTRAAMLTACGEQTPCRSHGNAVTSRPGEAEAIGSTGASARGTVFLPAHEQAAPSPDQRACTQGSSWEGRWWFEVCGPLHRLEFLAASPTTSSSAIASR